MLNLEVEKVMNRQKIADTIHTILDTGVELLEKQNLSKDDHTKIKVIRTLGSHVNAGVAMIQQETAQQRAVIVAERMKQLGYGGEEPKQIEG